MFAKARFWPVLLTLNLLGSIAVGQTPPAQTPPAQTPPTAVTGEKVPPPLSETPPAPDVVAGVVNGQTIPELAVFRGLLRVKPQQREQARVEVINYLI